MKSHPYLETLKAKGIILGLDRVTRALSKIKNPQDSQKGVLVAGTNGKGSTSFILYKLLLSHGFKTALYTSPHIREINDRYLINDRKISDDELLKYIEDMKWLCEEFDLTLFEFETIVAFKYFFDNKVDYAIYEVGMGGRLDVTNCFNPKFKIITSISKDHTEFLGETEEKILFEKAGIVKPNNTVISGISEPHLISLLERYCNERGAHLLLFQRDFIVTNVREKEFEEVFDYQYKDISLKDIKLSMFGRHQVQNCSLSLTSFIELMNLYRHKVNKELIYDTLKNVRYSGRFEIYSRNPFIVIDGAHNKDGILRLKDSIVALNKDKKYKILVIFSSLRNKDPFEKVRILGDIVDKFIFVENEHPLSLKNDEFIMLAHKLNLRYFEIMNISSAINSLFTNHQNYLIIIAGSLYTLPKIYDNLDRFKKYAR